MMISTCLIVLSLFLFSCSAGPAFPGQPPNMMSQCQCPWPATCPQPEPFLTLCGVGPPYNGTLLELTCSNPACIEPLVACYRQNCSNDTASFFQDVLCGRNEQGNLCWNMLAESVTQGKVECTSCQGPLSQCTANCNETIQGVMEALGCRCSASFLNNSIVPPHFVIVSNQALAVCNVDVAERCDVLLSPSPSLTLSQSTSSRVPPVPSTSSARAIPPVPSTYFVEAPTSSSTSSVGATPLTPSTSSDPLSVTPSPDSATLSTAASIVTILLLALFNALCCL